MHHFKNLAQKFKKSRDRRRSRSLGGSSVGSTPDVPRSNDSGVSPMAFAESSTGLFHRRQRDVTEHTEDPLSTIRPNPPDLRAWQQMTHAGRVAQDHRARNADQGVGEEQGSLRRASLQVTPENQLQGVTNGSSTLSNRRITWDVPPRNSNDLVGLVRKRVEDIQKKEAEDHASSSRETQLSRVRSAAQREGDDGRGVLRDIPRGQRESMRQYSTAPSESAVFDYADDSDDEHTPSHSDKAIFPTTPSNPIDLSSDSRFDSDADVDTGFLDGRNVETPSDFSFTPDKPLWEIINELRREASISDLDELEDRRNVLESTNEPHSSSPIDEMLDEIDETILLYSSPSTDESTAVSGSSYSVASLHGYARYRTGSPFPPRGIPDTDSDDSVIRPRPLTPRRELFPAASRQQYPSVYDRAASSPLPRVALSSPSRSVARFASSSEAPMSSQDETSPPIPERSLGRARVPAHLRYLPRQFPARAPMQISRERVRGEFRGLWNVVDFGPVPRTRE